MNTNELQGAKILIVDDTPENVGVLFDYFHKLGSLILIAESGEDALELVSEMVPDIILLDILMPGIDGFETCRQLKRCDATREVPVLFISSLTETVDKVRGFEAGGVDYVSKPFQAEEVLARIGTHLSNYRLKKQLEAQNRRLEQEIAQHKLTEQALKKAKDEANSASRAKSVFLAHMSHELRTPLNGVLGYAQILLRDRTLSQRQKDSVAVIQQSGEHLLSMINEVLDLSRIEARQIHLEPHDFRFAEFLYSIADMIRVQALKKGVTFTVEISPDLPLIVHGDNKRLRQILLNLLSNAIKFTEHGTVEFRVTSRRRIQHSDSSPPLSEFLFEVEDTGIGISAEQLSSLFEPFRHTENQYAHSQGTGLGLSISQHFVQLMGGELSVESEVERGTRFWFSIQLPEGSQAGAERIRSAPLRPITGIQGTPPTILVTDDHAPNREVLKAMLEPLGCTIFEASDGHEAIQRATEIRPDVVLMDLVMPGMDGFETTRRLRQIPELEKTVILAVSANVFEHTAQQGREAGCQDFLGKPFTEARLLDMLQQYLHIEWTYDDQEPPVTPPPSEEPLIAPPQEELVSLYEASLIGDIMVVRQHVELVRSLDPQFVSFAEKISLLAKDFNIRGIQRFLQQYIDKT